jgi:hypothetical protein
LNESPQETSGQKPNLQQRTTSAFGGATEPTSGRKARAQGRLGVAISIAALAVLVWALNPRSPKVTPAPLRPPTPECVPLSAGFTPSSLTAIPQLSEQPPLPASQPSAAAALHAAFRALPAADQQRVLLRLNLSPCRCGCQLSIAACLSGNRMCATSRDLALKILRAPAKFPASPTK